MKKLYGTYNKPELSGDDKFSIYDFLSVVVLFAVVFALYHSTLSASFISFDDSVYVYDNPVISNGFTIESLGKIFSFKQDSGPYWHPVTSLSHMADCQLFGLNSGLHHLSNVLLHALNSVLIFLFFRFSTRRFTESFLVALIFAVHPINVETVAWVSERKNLLVTFFFILGMYAWRLHVGNRNGYTYLFLWSAFFLGIMSKPVMMTFPFAVLLVHHFPLDSIDHSSETVKGFIKENAKNVKPVFQIILVMLLMFFAGFSMSGTSRTAIPLEHVDFSLRLSNMVVNYIVYLKAFLFPFDLTVFRPFPKAVSHVSVFLSSVFIAAVSVFAFKMYRRFPWFFFGWFWFTGNLVTASGLIQKGHWPAWADRFFYLPMTGVIVIFIWGLSELGERFNLKKIIIWPTGIAVSLFFVSLSLEQVSHWKNEETLFRHAVKVNPEDALSLSNLALALGKQGKTDEAIAISEKAISIEPGYAEALNNMGTLLARKGEVKESISWFKKAVESYPEFEEAKENLDKAMKLAGTEHVSEVHDKDPEVVEEHKVDIKKEDNKKRDVNPDKLEEAAELALVLVSEKKYDEAENLYMSMLVRHPDAKISILYNLACLYSVMGLHDKAMIFLENSVRSGFTSWDHMKNDKDLESLWERPDFKALLDLGKKG